MRTFTLVRAMVVLSCVALPPGVRAQFQIPTAEELKMTSDPKAPGAAAVYLNIDEEDNDPLHSHTYYARIKVLTEKGEDLATVPVQYMAGPFKVTDIKARTIHADGTEIRLEGTPDELLKVKQGEISLEQKVFTLPSVEVGSILEYSFRISYDEHLYSSPIWDIQKKYFVRKAHYQFTPYKDFMPPPFGPSTGLASSAALIDARGRTARSLDWWERLPEGAKLETKGTVGAGYFALDLMDIPPLPDEEWMPPMDSLVYRVFFYYQYASSLANFWPTEGALWSKDVDHFAEPSKPIQEAVAGLISPGDSELGKAQKLYAAVQALDNTNFSRQKSESELKQLKLKPARRAEDAWAQKSGSGNDLAMLYLAMLRAAGLHAYAAEVVDREETTFDRGYMNINQLTEDLVILDSGGQEIFLDPGEKMCPFGLLHWRHSGATGIRQSAQGLELTTTAEQNYLANTVKRTGSLDLDGHGHVSGSFNVIMSGQEALRWRQAALRSDGEEVKKQFDEELKTSVPESVEAHVDHFLGLGQSDSNLIAAVRVQGTMGTSMGRRLILPGFFFQTRAHVPFVNEQQRLVPVDMRYGDRMTDDVAYHLPAGVTLEGAPQDANVSWPGHALYATQLQSDGGQIVLVRSLARAFSEVQPGEYQDLRGFYQKVATGDGQELVLQDGAEAKGN